MTTATLFLTVLTDGRVDVTYHEHTRTGRVQRSGQRFMIAPWTTIVQAFAPGAECRVVVRCEHASNMLCSPNMMLDAQNAKV